MVITQAVLDAVIREGPLAIPQLLTLVDAPEPRIRRTVWSLAYDGNLEACGAQPNPGRKPWTLYRFARAKKPAGRPWPQKS